MGKRGPEAWEPSEAERRMIEHYVAIGYTQEQIAALIGKSVDSLQRHCRNELDNGSLKVNAKVTGKLYQKAMEGDTASIIFWTKTRMGWTEKSALEHSGGVKLTHTTDMTRLSNDELQAIIAGNA